MKTVRLLSWVLPISLVMGSAGMALAQDEDPPAEGGEMAPEEAPPEGGEAPMEGDAAATEGDPAGSEAAPSMAADVEASATLTKANWPLALVDRPITLVKGLLQVRGDINVNLTKELEGKPFAIAPDIYYGVSDVLNVGLIHGTGLCLAGKENGCAKVYNDVGIDAIYALTLKQFQAGAHVAVLVGSFDPEVVLGANVGVLLQYTMGKINFYFDPKVYIGLTQRDAGNKEKIDAPLEIDYQVTPKLAASLFTGIGGPLDGFADFMAVPVGVGALFGMSNKLDVGGAFVFPNLAGKGGTADARALNIFVNFRM
ncbi:MAG: hypothetical protein IT370_04325 [Deltaproteobacteria bacterium]|nr:hypothetical protein [Deltaproteobacteria bacterium]